MVCSWIVLNLQKTSPLPQKGGIWYDWKILKVSPPNPSTYATVKLGLSTHLANGHQSIGIHRYLPWSNRLRCGKTKIFDLQLVAFLHLFPIRFPGNYPRVPGLWENPWEHPLPLGSSKLELRWFQEKKVTFRKLPLPDIPEQLLNTSCFGQVESRCHGFFGGF